MKDHVIGIALIVRGKPLTPLSPSPPFYFDFGPVAAEAHRPSILFPPPVIAPLLF